MRFEVAGREGSIKPRVVELFAGVGGFRLGLGESWDVVWSNQWEPSTKRQHAERNANDLRSQSPALTAREESSEPPKRGESPRQTKVKFWGPANTGGVRNHPAANC